VIKALLEGADGVLVSGCHPGDCHYINGNFKARRRIKLLKEILPQFGFAPERLRLTWIGASDGIQFAETIRAACRPSSRPWDPRKPAGHGDLNALQSGRTNMCKYGTMHRIGRKPGPFR
jgi:hypothetical protein